MEPCPVISATSMRGRKLLDLLQEFKARHVRHDHVGEDHVNGLFFEQGQGGLAALGFQAGEAERFADGQQSWRMVCSSSTISKRMRRSSFTDVIHSAFPKVFETTSMKC